MSNQNENKSIEVAVLKVDEDLRLVFGMALVSKVKKADGTWDTYRDVHGDHIPEGVVLKSALDFMNSGNPELDIMHNEQKVGEFVFMFPMTEEVAESYGLDVVKTGLYVGARVDDDDALERFRSGELTGFSIDATMGFVRSDTNA